MAVSIGIVSFEPADVDQKIFRCGFAYIGMCAHRVEG